MIGEFLAYTFVFGVFGGYVAVVSQLTTELLAVTFVFGGVAVLWTMTGRKRV